MDLKTNKHLFLQLKSCNNDLNDFNSLFNIVVQNLKLDLSNKENDILKESLRIFCIKLSKKWQKSQRTYERFLKNNQLWLSRNFVWPKFIFSRSLVSSNSHQDSPKKNANPLKIHLENKTEEEPTS